MGNGWFQGLHDTSQFILLIFPVCGLGFGLFVCHLNFVRNSDLKCICSGLFTSTAPADKIAYTTYVMSEEVIIYKDLFVSLLVLKF